MLCSVSNELSLFLLNLHLSAISSSSDLSLGSLSSLSEALKRLSDLCGMRERRRFAFRIFATSRSDGVSSTAEEEEAAEGPLLDSVEKNLHQRLRAICTAENKIILRCLVLAVLWKQFLQTIFVTQINYTAGTIHLHP